MKYRYWEPIPQDLLLYDVVDESLLALGDGEALVLTVDQVVLGNQTAIATQNTTPAHWVNVEYWRPSASWANANLVYNTPTTIQEMLKGRLDAHTVMVIPRIARVPEEKGRWFAYFFAGLGTALVLATALAGLHGAVVLFIATGAALATWRALQQRPTRRVLVAGQGPLTLQEAVEYGRRRAAGERPELDRLAGRQQSAEERVELVRAEYGRQKIDIVTRVEQPALFDEAAPTTASFLQALIAYDEAQTLQERERAAADVEMSYSMAVDHAAAVGINHLPAEAREAGRRAAKAARLAERATSHGEREASLFQVKRILESLALYYMPRLNERLAIEHPDAS